MGLKTTPKDKYFNVRNFRFAFSLKFISRIYFRIRGVPGLEKTSPREIQFGQV